MKQSLKISLVGSLLVAMSTHLLAEEVVVPVASETVSSHVSSDFISVLPEGQTLPQNVIRTRIVTQTNAGTTQTYDKDSKAAPHAMERSFTAAALVVEYGILNDLTAQLAAPFVLNNSYESAGQTTKAQTGLSDLEAGALYNFLNNGTVVLSAGLGMRFATGQYADAKKETEMTGRGSYDLGLRLNADYQVARGLWLSLQDQEELGISSVEHKAAKRHLDKKGLSRKAFAQAAYGLGAMSQSLKALSVKGRYGYEYASAVEVRETKATAKPASMKHTAGGGLGIDGRGYNIPVSLDALYMVPVAGTNVTEALPTVEMTLSAYVQI